ncbi:hypothetical protein PR202_ga00317 [Eleusine coracana subsp. coracana]|uniref:Uncharacterized protein n=1 Tax=Eleusine coracana subsp. coracana TaxID=191504 RepID=A0AAV5BC07_ELECO|nr:hypothetical protein PR202_ga00317 [Eleusine coracana subsp. coracana]
MVWLDLQCLVRRKPATASSAGRHGAADRGGGGQHLAKTLSVPYLIAIGVGSTMGAGIYVLVGTVAREHTGPALTVSFLIAGVAAALSALCYAELSCRFPSAGSAYHYCYICIGESYFPNGVSGVLSGSANLFFAYIGFDVVASTAEEVKNPQRDLPLGMGLTLVICFFLYMMVSAVIVGLVPYHAMDPETPVSSAFVQYGVQWAVYVVSSGALLALIASLIGGILPQFLDLFQVSVGTLLAFTTVAISVLVVRYAPPYEMPMEVALGATPESLASYSADSHQDENLKDPFGDVQEVPNASELIKERRQKAMRSILVTCIGVIAFISAASFSFLPFSMHSQSGSLFLRFHVPLGSITSSLLHHHQYIPSYEHWVRKVAESTASHTWIRVSVWLVAGAPIYIFYGRKHSTLASMAYQRILPT